MKEYIAETGGRYTYSDDILNLQELSLSMTELFSECSAFIISGCHAEQGVLTPGYVWLGEKVRYFEGSSNFSYPFYIYEANDNESVIYANDQNKRGRCCYRCAGGNSVPQAADPLTGQLPLFIEITQDYAPRLADKFFGRYSLLLDPVSGKQKVKKDVSFAGEVSVDKGVTSYKDLSVLSASGHALRGKVKDNGDAALGAYLNGLLASEITLNADGSFSFVSGGDELARMDTDGFVCRNAGLASAQIGAVGISYNHITNPVDDTDEGAVNVNYSGYNHEASRFRNFNVWDGKRCSVPLFSIEGKTKTASVNGLVAVKGKGTGYVLQNIEYAKGDIRLTSVFQWQDRQGEAVASAGYLSAESYDFTLGNLLGDIVLAPKGAVNLAGAVTLKGKDIYSIFVTQTSFTGELSKKVSAVSGKQLSTEDFTAAHKKKLDAIATGKISSGGDGYVTAGDTVDALKNKLSADKNLSDLTDTVQARKNISVYSVAEIEGLLAKKLGTDGAYTGVVFTESMRKKLEGVKTGNFAYIDSGGVSHAQVEGYVFVSQVAAELQKKADRLMAGYNAAERQTIAFNIDVYSQSAADNRYAKIQSLFRDYVTYLVSTGVTTGRAHEMMREELEVYSKKEINENYLNNKNNLSDLVLPNATAKRTVCRNLGAAYADDYQTKITDTGWQRMINSGPDTDTSRLFIRQIGSVVSIQGIINTAYRNGTNAGGVVGVIPNQIQPPRYGVRNAICDFDSGAKFNRGATFVIKANSRTVQIYESGWYNVTTEINFTYFV